MNDLVFRDTIEPKSDQLNADDLFSGPRTFEIVGVRRGTREQPVEIALKNSRPYRPCKSMRRVLIRAWGDDGHQWVGRSMTLYCDYHVKFGGVKVGGIRISHLSHIPAGFDIPLTVTRAKRQPFHVESIERSEAQTNRQYPDTDFDANLPKWRDLVDAGKVTPQQIIERCQRKGTLTEEQITVLRSL